MDQIGEKALDLGSVRFTGKIDYVTVQTAGRTALPSLKGRAVWPKSHGGRRLTIHDAVRGDVDAIVATLGNLRLVEFEIAIDVRPAPHVPESCRRQLLEQVMVDIFARGLDPSAGQGMSSAFRAFYRRLDKGYVVQPFNIALPRPTDQQL
ncbi:MAG: hypothetical protein KDH18_11205, partial [Rhodoferax sp.]|nr:hypothetical protein [Rhodoferax sp.]